MHRDTQGVNVKQRQLTKRSRRGLVPFAAAALLAMTAATAQVAGSPAGGTGIDASGDYRSEVRSCLDGRTQQDRETCLREARNARSDKQRGQLDAQGANGLQSNAMQRCEPFKGEERAACEARVMGYGNVSGSVAEGGLLREVETVVMPPGASEITVEPKTDNPVVLVPRQ
jgi:hypothetical protein